MRGLRRSDRDAVTSVCSGRQRVQAFGAVVREAAR